MPKLRSRHVDQSNFKWTQYEPEGFKTIVASYSPILSEMFEQETVAIPLF